MNISYNELKNKEIINLEDGKKLGHIVDILFDSDNGKVKGISAPGEKKIFRRSEDIFIPLEKIRKIGDDVILVRIDYEMGEISHNFMNNNFVKNGGNDKGQNVSYIKYRRVANSKYK